ncbi:MAG: hypothetical protein ACPKPY_06825, partial [Nitrososphaeraceae archaeon]
MSIEQKIMLISDSDKSLEKSGHELSITFNSIHSDNKEIIAIKKDNEEFKIKNKYAKIIIQFQDRTCIQASMLTNPDEMNNILEGEFSSIQIKEFSNSNSEKQFTVTTTSNEILDKFNFRFNILRIKYTSEIDPYNLLYDSNIHGKWNNGQKRTIRDKEGDQTPNG